MTHRVTHQMNKQMTHQPSSNDSSPTSFFSCHLRVADSPTGSAEEFEVLLDDNSRLIVRRQSRWLHRYPRSADDQSDYRVAAAMSDTTEDMNARNERIRKVCFQ